MAVKSNFASGDVLTASDVNTYLTNAGLVYITNGTLSSTTTNFASAFTTTYTNYRIIIDRPQLSGAGDIYWRLLSGTTPATSTDYGWGYIGRTFGASTVTSESNGSSSVYTGFTQSGVNNTPIGAITIDMYGPKVTSRTFGLTQACGYNGTYFFSYQGLGQMNLTTQYDGIQFLTNTAVTMGGNVTIYGYRIP